MLTCQFGHHQPLRVDQVFKDVCALILNGPFDVSEVVVDVVFDIFFIVLTFITILVFAIFLDSLFLFLLFFLLFKGLTFSLRLGFLLLCELLLPTDRC